VDTIIPNNEGIQYTTAAAKCSSFSAWLSRWVLASYIVLFYKLIIHG